MLANEKDLKKFGLEVRKAREAAKLSQTALAAKAGFSNKHLNHIEYGTNWPSMKTYIALCRALGAGKIPLVPTLVMEA